MSSLPRLTILEEFLLLALDDQAGAFWPLPRSVFDYGTACAILMDLMLQGRVDCDMRRLLITATEPTGDDILDPVLQALALEPTQGTRALPDELRFLADEGEGLRERAVLRLIERGILKREQRKIFWVFGARRYPILDDQEIREVKLRILGAILGPDTPELHDIMLVALAHACGLFQNMLSVHELAHTLPRIEQVAQMDLLGHALAAAIAEVEGSIAMASGLR
jgi:hypothetical protein